MAFKSLNDVFKAVDEGKTVHWKLDSYLVVKDTIGQYMVHFLPEKGNYYGLYKGGGWDPKDFYIGNKELLPKWKKEML